MNGTSAVWHAPSAPEVVVRTGRGRRHALRLLLSVGLAAALLVFVLPRVVGTTLREVLDALSLVSGRQSVVVTLLWAAGLLVYSFVLTGALPGLSRRRALTLNLTGSAVANVVPLGGAAGMSINYVMIRAWGFGASGFSTFTLVTNVWAILSKLALPAIALAALVVSGEHISSALRWTGLGAAVALGLLVAVLLWGLATRSAAERAVGVGTPVVAWGSRLLRRPLSREDAARELLEFRDRVAEVVSRHWLQLSSATVGYGVLQAALLWACLHAVGAPMSAPAVLAAYALERVMTLIFLTPGGTGFAEAGVAAALVAFGGAPALMTAGVLLYRGFTFALEIPVGGAWLGAWFLLRRRRATIEQVEAEALPAEKAA